MNGYEEDTFLYILTAKVDELKPGKKYIFKGYDFDRLTIIEHEYKMHS